MSNFDISIEVYGLDMLVKNLKSVPATDIMRKVVNNAKKRTSAAYARGAVDGNTDYSLRVYGSKAKNYVTLTAKGNDVGFLEFGAGSSVDDSNVFIEQVSYPVYPGSWGIEHPNFYTRQYAYDGYWYWGADRENVNVYTAIEPTQGMQDALDYLYAAGQDEIIHRVAHWIATGKV